MKIIKDKNFLKLFIVLILANLTISTHLEISKEENEKVITIDLSKRIRRVERNKITKIKLRKDIVAENFLCGTSFYSILCDTIKTALDKKGIKADVKASGIKLDLPDFELGKIFNKAPEFIKKFADSIGLSGVVLKTPSFDIQWKKPKGAKFSTQLKIGDIEEALTFTRFH